jgi:2-keto-3-deoxy-L-rhamnonate aldolase RhmA
MIADASLVERLRSGQPVIGSWMQIPHPMVAETLAQTGVDFLLVDGEHAPIPPHMLLQVLPGVDRFGMPIIYRVPWNRPEYIKAALDIGATGVMVPMVNSAAEARQAVAAARYPPSGTRGIGAWRASNYYQNDSAYRATANENALVVVQIETIEALHAVDEIAATPGVDVMFVGTGDLALSMGKNPGALDADLLEACRLVALAARDSGIVAGIVTGRPDDLPIFRQMGFRFFTHGVDVGYILEGGRRVSEAMRAGLD